MGFMERAVGYVDRAVGFMDRAVGESRGERSIQCLPLENLELQEVWGGLWGDRARLRAKVRAAKWLIVLSSTCQGPIRVMARVSVKLRF